MRDGGVVRRVAAALSLLLSATVARDACAQVVRVEAVDEVTGRAVGGALVALLDTAERRVSAVLTAPDGRATLRAVSPGLHRVLAERVGFERWLSPAHALALGDTLSLLVRLPARRVMLDAIQVTGSTECERAPERGAQTAALWTEVRKALEASDLTRRDRLLRLEVRRFTRQLDARLRVQDERTSSRRMVTERPFRTPAAAQLERDGWVRTRVTGPEFLGPDERVLLSEGFLGAHCFAPVVPARGSEEAEQGLVGLGFRPVPSRTLPEIEGTIWLDRATAELREVEYRYVNVEQIVRMSSRRAAPHVGGRIEFERLPTGSWIVSRWYIRTPRVARVSGQRGNRIDHAPRDTLLGYQEDGGEAAPAQLAGEARVVLVGSIVDSTRGTPLAGAEVALAGGAYGAVTDSTGAYRIAVPDAREYGLRVRHPRLAALRLDDLAESVVLREGETRLDLAVPGVATLRSRLCGEAGRATVGGDGTKEPGLLVGRVVAAPLGTPVGGATVRISWARIGVAGRASGRVMVSSRGTRMDVQADAEGRFVGCGLPPDEELRLEVVGVEAARTNFMAGPGREPVVIPPGGLVERVLTVDR